VTIHASTVSVPPHGVDDSQLANSVDRPVTVDLVEPSEHVDNWTFGSQWKSDQKFNSKVCFLRALDAKLTDLGRLY
jgi:hypothetical protein